MFRQFQDFLVTARSYQYASSITPMLPIFAIQQNGRTLFIIIWFLAPGNDGTFQIGHGTSTPSGFMISSRIGRTCFTLGISVAFRPQQGEHRQVC